MRIGRQEMISAYVRPQQKKALQKLSKKLSKKTDKSVAELIREGIDLVLDEYKAVAK